MTIKSPSVELSGNAAPVAEIVSVVPEATDTSVVPVATNASATPVATNVAVVNPVHNGNQIPWADFNNGQGLTSDGHPVFLRRSSGTKVVRWGYAFGEGPLGVGYYSFETKEGSRMLVERLKAKERGHKLREASNRRHDDMVVPCCRRGQSKIVGDEERVREAITMRAFAEARLNQDYGPMTPIPHQVLVAYGAVLPRHEELQRPKFALTRSQIPSGGYASQYSGAGMYFYNANPQNMADLGYYDPVSGGGGG